MFRMEPNPTFEKTVLIPEAGGAGQKMRAVFRYMPLAEYVKRFRAMANGPITDFLYGSAEDDKDAGLLAGWHTVDAPDGAWLGMPEPYGREALERLLKSFPRSGQALAEAYRAEMYTGGALPLGN